MRLEILNLSRVNEVKREIWKVKCDHGISIDTDAVSLFTPSLHIALAPVNPEDVVELYVLLGNCVVSATRGRATPRTNTNLKKNSFSPPSPSNSSSRNTSPSPSPSQASSPHPSRGNIFNQVINLKHSPKNGASMTSQRIKGNVTPPNESSNVGADFEDSGNRYSETGPNTESDVSGGRDGSSSGGESGGKKGTNRSRTATFTTRVIRRNLSNVNESDEDDAWGSEDGIDSFQMQLPTSPEGGDDDSQSLPPAPPSSSSKEKGGSSSSSKGERSVSSKAKGVWNSFIGKDDAKSPKAAK
jgi:hypothetical protein